MTRHTVRYAFFLHLRALPQWLRLPRSERGVLAQQHLLNLVPRYEGRLTLRHFDAEAFSAPCSDVMLVETADPVLHYDLMERLRDSPLITHPYFEVLQIIPTIEDGYQAFEQGLHGH